MLIRTENGRSTATPDVMTTRGKLPVAPTLVGANLKDAKTLAEEPRIMEELVIEEVGIDGMCGVY